MRATASHPTSDASASTPTRAIMANMPLDPPPAEAARIAHARQQPQPAQVVVDEAARAEPHSEVDAGEHEDNGIQRPARNRHGSQEQQQAGRNQEGRTDGLGEAM